jgi:hypothetical protein
MRHGGPRDEAEARPGHPMRAAEDQHIGLEGVRDGLVGPLQDQHAVHECGSAAPAHDLRPESSPLPTLLREDVSEIDMEGVRHG